MIAKFKLHGKSMGNMCEGESSVDLDAEYKIGDIIVYSTDYCDRGFVVHRIVSIEDEQILTKGDANNTLGPPIHKSCVLEKVIV